MPLLFEKCLYIPPRYEGHERFKAAWEDLLNAKEGLFVEYGSGNGQWISSMAQEKPLSGWIAVERDFSRARKLWLRIFRLGLNNLFLVYGEGYTFTRYYLPDGCVDGVFVNFPDPWPKRRHFKHRLIQDEFIAELERTMRPQSPVTITTDDAAYSEWIMKKFFHWKSAFDAPGYVTEWPNFGDSYFYSLWRRQQRLIRFHKYFRGRGI